MLLLYRLLFLLILFPTSKKIFFSPLYVQDAAEVGGGGGLWETAGSVVSGMADAAINLGSLLGSTFFGGSDGTITEQGEHIRFHDLDGNDITNKVTRRYCKFF